MINSHKRNSLSCQAVGWKDVLCIPKQITKIVIARRFGKKYRNKSNQISRRLHFLMVPECNMSHLQFWAKKAKLAEGYLERTWSRAKKYIYIWEQNIRRTRFFHCIGNISGHKWSRTTSIFSSYRYIALLLQWMKDIFEFARDLVPATVVKKKQQCAKCPLSTLAFFSLFFSKTYLYKSKTYANYCLCSSSISISEAPRRPI